MEMTDEIKCFDGNSAEKKVSKEFTDRWARTSSTARKLVGTKTYMVCMLHKQKQKTLFHRSNTKIICKKEKELKLLQVGTEMHKRSNYASIVYYAYGKTREKGAKNMLKKEAGNLVTKQ